MPPPGRPPPLGRGAARARWKFWVRTSPRWSSPSLRWNEGGPKVRTPPSQTLLYFLSARRALLERGLFTHLQGPLGVQEPVKLDGFGHEPGPAGLVAGA